MVQQAEITEQPGLIQSVQRAASLLKAFADGSTELGVTELSQKVRLHKSTVSRLLATLEREGLLERVPGNDKYRIGLEIVRLAGQAPHFRDLRAVAQPILEQLAATSQETTNLAVLDGDDVINVQQVSGPHLVRDTNWVGRRTPSTCAANGKVLLAYRTPEAIDRVLAQPLPRCTDQAVTDPERLRAELLQVRERGYAQALGEIEVGLNAVAAPVRDVSGQVVAAISVSGPAYRVTAERIAPLGTLTVEAADELSARLGYVLVAHD